MTSRGIPITDSCYTGSLLLFSKLRELEDKLKKDAFQKGLSANKQQMQVCRFELNRREFWCKIQLFGQILA